MNRRDRPGFAAQVAAAVKSELYCLFRLSGARFIARVSAILDDTNLAMIFHHASDAAIMR
jgi:hypothetical protein